VSTFIRWLKFNLVGAMGMIVQLGALALFNRLTAGRYLLASAAALEVRLLPGAPSFRSFIAEGWDSTNLNRLFSDPAGCPILSQSYRGRMG
jgi:hypothetical protein